MIVALHQARSFYVKCPLHCTTQRSCSRQMSKGSDDVYWLLKGHAIQSFGAGELEGLEWSKGRPLSHVTKLLFWGEYDMFTRPIIVNHWFIFRLFFCMWDNVRVRTNVVEPCYFAGYELVRRTNESDEQLRARHVHEVVPRLITLHICMSCMCVKQCKWQVVKTPDTLTLIGNHPCIRWCLLLKVSQVDQSWRTCSMPRCKLQNMTMVIDGDCSFVWDRDIE